MIINQLILLNKISHIIHMKRFDQVLKSLISYQFLLYHLQNLTTLKLNVRKALVAGGELIC